VVEFLSAISSICSATLSHCKVGGTKVECSGHYMQASTLGDPVGISMFASCILLYLVLHLVIAFLFSVEMRCFAMFCIVF
jgi:hypothetical protein